MHLGRNNNAMQIYIVQLSYKLRPTTEQKDLAVWITPAMNFSVDCYKVGYMINYKHTCPQGPSNICSATCIWSTLP